MKLTRIPAILVVTALLARADVLPPAQDTSSLKGKLTPAAGKATTLAVNSKSTAFVLFDLDNLPADVQSGDIASARLRVYFPSVIKAGEIDVHTVTPGGQLWTENTAEPAPAVDAAVIKTFPAETVVKKKFVEVDVTATVQAWRAGTPQNYGFAFVATGATNATIGAKEGSGSGYPCELDLEIGSPIGAGTIGTAQIADGAVGSEQIAAGISLAGTIGFSGGINLVATDNSGSVGVITQNGTPLLHTFGTQNVFVGTGAGNFTMTGAANTASGYQTLFNNTTGASNTANGFQALFNNTTGGSNTAIGVQALSANTTGNYNTASGNSALAFNTTGSTNTASGVQALYSNTMGASNTASGYQALLFNTTGNSNTASGAFALVSNTTASRNVAVGQSTLSLQSFSNGGVAYPSDNVAVGFEALLSNQPTSTGTGYANTAMGTSAMRSNTTGDYNTANGDQALVFNTTGDSNTASGAFALASNTSGAGNTAIGYRALVANSVGSFNTAIGEEALLSNMSGSGNTAIGYDATVFGNNLNNATAIGFGAQVDASNKVRIGDANVTVIQGAVAYTFTSDRNKKENFLPVDGAEVLRKIRGFPLTSWNYIGKDEKPIRHYGVMAQDFYAAFGHDVLGTIGTPITVNSGDMDGIMMSAIQGLDEENAALRVEAAATRQRLAELEARFMKLEQFISETPKSGAATAALKKSD